MTFEEMALRTFEAMEEYEGRDLQIAFLARTIKAWRPMFAIEDARALLAFLTMLEEGEPEPWAARIVEVLSTWVTPHIDTEIENMRKEDEILDGLDPDIKDLVAFLRERGVETMDSGDGVSKREAIEEGAALPVPHVHVASSAASLIRDSMAVRHVVAQYVRETGDRRFEKLDVQAIYSPTDGIATVSVFGERVTFELQCMSGTCALPSVDSDGMCAKHSSITKVTPA